MDTSKSSVTRILDQVWAFSKDGTLSMSVVTPQAVTELLAHGIAVRDSNNIEELTKDVFQATCLLLRFRKDNPSVFYNGNFLYAVVKRYLDILLDTSGSPSTVFTVQIPYTEQWWNICKKNGWYLEYSSSSGEPQMLMSNVVHTPHGGYDS